MVAAPFIAEHISGICQQFLRDRSGDTRIEQMNGLDPRGSEPLTAPPRPVSRLRAGCSNRRVCACSASSHIRSATSRMRQTARARSPRQLAHPVSHQPEAAVWDGCREQLAAHNGLGAWEHLKLERAEAARAGAGAAHERQEAHVLVPVARHACPHLRGRKVCAGVSKPNGGGGRSPQACTQAKQRCSACLPRAGK
eukprot:354880-Chlamydomonas_euryale.AAC.1